MRQADSVAGFVLYQVILDGYYLKAADNRQFIAQLVQLSRDEAYYARACEMSARGNRFYSEEHVLGMWQEILPPVLAGELAAAE